MNFSLYRGDMHKVPDVPRRWPLSKPSIPLHTFKKALAKRQEALDRLAQSSGAIPSSSHHACNGAMDDLGHRFEAESEDLTAFGNDPDHRKRKSEDPHPPGKKIAKLDEEQNEATESKGFHHCPSLHDPVAVNKDGTFVGPKDDHNALEADVIMRERRLESDLKTNAEENVNSDARILKAGRDDISTSCEAVVFRQVNQKAKRKAELEEKLKELNEEKHRLVQRLKQVLSSEEESRKRNQGSIQSPASLINATTPAAEVPNITLQSDGRLGFESHSSAELEEGELEYTQTPSPSPRFTSGAQLNSYGGNAMLGPSPSTRRHSNNSFRVSQTWRWQSSRQ